MLSALLVRLTIQGFNSFRNLISSKLGLTKDILICLKIAKNLKDQNGINDSSFIRKEGVHHG